MTPSDHTQPIPDQPDGAHQATADEAAPTSHDAPASAADTEQLPPTPAPDPAAPAWAQAGHVPEEGVPVAAASEAAPAAPVTAAPAAAPVATAPAVRPPRWSGKKTAVAAALAVGLGVGAAAGATTAFALGDDGGGRGDTSQFGPGRGGPGGQGGQGGPGGQMPGQGQMPGGHDGGRGGPGQDPQQQGGTSSDPGDANGTGQTT
ncbi:hypothetical protein [Oryzobacter telluris]|uniref:hypothetical protein n=1 Tax=Oryzobacter telluris TaxID=3149179 RepID=UPI00370D0663